jgi:hypothetical protein
MKLDLENLTMDEVGTEIDRTISKLHKLQGLYAALQEEDRRRIEKLIKEYRKAQQKEKEVRTSAPGPTPVVVPTHGFVTTGVGRSSFWPGLPPAIT